MQPPYAHVKTALMNKMKIGILGYGNQGRAQALNLSDSGFEVCIGLRNQSTSIKLARKDGFHIFSLRKLASHCDILMFLTPDETHAEIFHECFPSLQRNQSHPLPTLGFSHSYSFIFGNLVIPKNFKYFLVAPKATGQALRQSYISGGVPTAVCWSHKSIKTLPFTYAKALGCSKNYIFYADFKEEVISNLFSEQALLPGGIYELLKHGYETMIENGISPTMAYYESFHKLKFMADILLDKGSRGMFEAISPIASYGALSHGSFVCNTNLKKRMKKILEDIQKSKFSKEWENEVKNNYKGLQKLKKKILNY